MKPDVSMWPPQTGDGQSRPAETDPPAISPPPINGKSAVNDHGAALRALTAADRRATRHRAVTRVATRRPGILKPIVFAGLAAFVAGILVAPRYRVAVRFALPPSLSAAERSGLRKELLDHAWRMLGQADEGNDLGAETWRVDSRADDSLTVFLVSTDPRQAAARLKDLADTFLDTLEARALRTRETPTDAERILSEYAAQLHQRLAEADAEVRTALAAMPKGNPQSGRAALLEQWQRLSSQFTESRTSLEEASSRLMRLRSEPQPDHGLVSAEDRRRALEADAALQADLKELAVNLADVKLHLLSIGAKAEPLLETLARAGDNLRTVILNIETAGAPSDLIENAERLTVEQDRYTDAFERLANTWRTVFDQLRSTPVDPMVASELDHCQTLAQHLDEFLFTSAAALTAMRSAVNDLGKRAGERARYHIIQSELARAFYTLQTAHHQFEFVAGRIDGPENFRLDAARRSAWGLRRRTQARIRDMDRILERRAAEEARRRHQEALDKAESLVHRIREATDRTVDELVALQERINEATQDTEAFHEALRLLEVATGKLELTRAHLDEARSRLTQLQAEREATPSGAPVTVTSCGPVGGPINRAERFEAGGLAFGVTFIAVMLGQWIVVRIRPSRSPQT